MPYIVLLRKVEFGEVGEIVGILQVRSSCISGLRICSGAVFPQDDVVVFYQVVVANHE